MSDDKPNNKSWRSVEIEQQCAYGISLEVVEKFLSDFSAVKQYAYIEHGRSVLGSDGLPIEANKEPHIHLLLWFKNPVPEVNLIAKFKSLGCELTSSQFEKIKRDDSAVSYLTHENCDKPTYPRSLVKANFEFDLVIDREIVRKSMRRDASRAAEIISLISSGEIKEYNLTSRLSAVEYNTYKRDIDNAFKYRLSMLRNDKERSMDCIYIYGDSGVGKSTYAKKICEDRGLDVFISSSSNDVLDGYASQPAIILDDLRPSCMGLSDLLKMLDNNTASSVRSRYSNKVLECKLIIITSTLPIDKFFNNVFSDQPETIVQLKRRCKMCIYMTASDIELSIYDPVKRDYVHFQTLENYVLKQYSIESMSDEQKLEFASSLLGSASDMLKNAIKLHESDKDKYLQGQLTVDDWMSASDFPFK